MAKRRALSERNYEPLGTPVDREGFDEKREVKDDIMKENTFHASAKGIFERGFYNGDTHRKIPMRELTIFNDIQTLKRGNVKNEEDVQFTDTKGFSEIDLVLREMEFTTLKEVTSSLEAVFESLLSVVSEGVDKDILWKKLLFVVNTREWNDTSSDKEIAVVLEEVRNRQMDVINDKWDAAIDARGKRVTVSVEEKECNSKIKALEEDPCGRILGGDVILGEAE